MVIGKKVRDIQIGTGGGREGRREGEREREKGRGQEG